MEYDSMGYLFKAVALRSEAIAQVIGSSFARRAEPGQPKGMLDVVDDRPELVLGVADVA